jgi:hypothetical protein
MPNASRRLSCGLEGSPAMPADLPCRQHATVQSCVNCQEPAVVPRDCFAYASTTTTGLVCGHPVWSVAMTSPLQGPAAVIRPSRDCYVFFPSVQGQAAHVAAQLHGFFYAGWVLCAQGEALWRLQCPSCLLSPLLPACMFCVVPDAGVMCCQQHASIAVSLAVVFARLAAGRASLHLTTLFNP